MRNGLYISAAALTREIEEDGWLLELPAVAGLRERPLVFHRPVTFFVGENGTGKSTLLEAIAAAWGFNPEGGTRNFTFSTRLSHSVLWRSLTLTKRGFARDGFFLRAESFYNVATSIEQLDSQPAFSPPVIDSYGGVSPASPTGRASWPWCRTDSPDMGCICWTSRRRPCPPSGS